MHHPALNIPDNHINLWRGRTKADKNDDKAPWDWATLVGPAWTEHGSLLGKAAPYWPGSFDRVSQTVRDLLCHFVLESEVWQNSILTYFPGRSDLL